MIASFFIAVFAAASANAARAHELAATPTATAGEVSREAGGDSAPAPGSPAGSGTGVSRGAAVGPASGARPVTPEVPDVPPPPPGKGLRLAAIPVIAFASDTGLRLAGGVFVYDLDTRDMRNDWAALQLSWTSRGPRYAEIKGEARDLFGTQLRSFYQLKLHDDVAAPYWGEGARLEGAPSPGNGSPPKEFQYHVTGPWLAASLRGPVRGNVGWFTRLRWTRRNIHERGAALEAQRPTGFEGGGLALLAGGLVLDSRDDEIGATRGVFADASVFGGPRLGRFSEHAMIGANVTVREYLPLWRGATLAMRQLYENKVGDVPFSERTYLEGLGYGEGIGGAGTIRGMARDRLAGEEKMLGSVELRARVLQAGWWGRVQEFGVSLGLDAGRARQRGYAPVHGVGGFAGLRLAWDRAVLVRFEVGNAGEGQAYYLSFDEPF
ncbi:MAG TPA: BamA/TamA family outer membrane protein [Anaeromyxobacteraceae bacterium]|nr:BamA/TamA family outer membrane protein [Anaeromyxobacteraceae bacterium]